MLRKSIAGKMLPLLVMLAAAVPASAAPAAPAAPAGRAPNLSATIRAFARDHGFSGTILVDRKGKPLYQGSFGLADRAFAIPVERRTRYRIASITKLFTSVLVMQLQQEGRIDLQAPVRTYLPDLAGEAGGKVSLHQLLNHTSGLAQWDDVPSYRQAFEKGVERYQRPLSSEALVAACCSGPLAHPPGTTFDYNNADYFLLGRIVERVTGMSYEEALAARILRPLGLRDTGMAHWDRIVPRLAPTYFLRGDSGALVPEMPVYWENWYAAASLYSTADDLLAFADALYGGRLLRPEALAKLLTPGLDDYGYGLWSYTIRRGGKDWRVAKRPGSVMGANAMLYRLLDRDETVVILANTNQADLDVFAQKIGDVLVAKP
jgi:CubicO group peptidase (beta-lactamase class C family)